MIRLLILWVTACMAGAALIPADRLGDWRPGVTVGVPGSIPNRLTNGATVVNLTGSLDITGATRSDIIIQNAINAAASNTVIILPATPGGFLNFSNTVLINKSGITVSGAGIDQTIVKPFGTAGSFAVGANPDFAWSFPPFTSNRIATAIRGASNITLLQYPSTPLFVGLLMKISQTNDYAYPVIHTEGYEYVRDQIVRITAAPTTNTLTFWPPLVADLTNAPVFAVADFIWNFSGVEGCTVVGTNATGTVGIGMAQGYGCWIRDIKVSQSRNIAFAISESVLCDFRGNWVDRSEIVGYPGPNHSGLPIGFSTGILIEDNIFYDQFPNLEMNGSVGCAVSYNFLAASFWGGTLNINHNPHGQFNLLEGNVSMNVQSDGYYGSEGPSTHLRNWYYIAYEGGSAAGQSSGAYAVSMNRLTRDPNFVGNILGNAISNLTYRGLLMFGKPNMGNETFSGYGPPWFYTQVDYPTATFTQAATLITASSGVLSSTNVGYRFLDFTASPIGSLRGILDSYISPTQMSVNQSGLVATPSRFRTAPGNAGWQEIDTNVVGTVIWKGNYTFPQAFPALSPSETNAIANPNPATFGQALGGDTVPDSYLYGSSAPDWWPPGLTNWPAIATNNLPTAGSGALSNNIRNYAQARFYGIDVTGNVPPSIIDQPDSSTIANGGSGTMTVVASGSPTLTYQWYVGVSGNTASPIGGATAATYNTPALFATTQYWVRVTNGSGTADSTTVTVTVLPPASPPVITNEPDDDTIQAGQTASLVVVASGDPVLTYQWYQGVSGVTTSPVSGETSSSFTTDPLSETTQFWVRVSNGSGTDDSRTATITVTPDDTAPFITEQPLTATIGEGGTVTLSVSASGTPPLSYQWYEGSVPDTALPVPGAVSSSFTSPPLFLSTSFWVRVTNAAGSADSETAIVNVVDPNTFSVYLEGVVEIRGRVRVQ